MRYECEVYYCCTANDDVLVLWFWNGINIVAGHQYIRQENDLSVMGTGTEAVTGIDSMNDNRKYITRHEMATQLSTHVNESVCNTHS